MMEQREHTVALLLDMVVSLGGSKCYAYYPDLQSS
jgi:hypothetical protein